jgi:hypothetical protein
MKFEFVKVFGVPTYTLLEYSVWLIVALEVTLNVPKFEKDILDHPSHTLDAPTLIRLLTLLENPKSRRWFILLVRTIISLLLESVKVSPAVLALVNVPRDILI